MVVGDVEGGVVVVGENDIVGDEEGKANGVLVGYWVGFSDG